MAGRGFPGNQPDLALLVRAPATLRPPTIGYSLQEAAAVLGIGVNTLRRRITAGQIRSEQSKPAPSEPAVPVWQRWWPSVVALAGLVVVVLLLGAPELSFMMVLIVGLLVLTVKALRR